MNEDLGLKLVAENLTYYRNIQYLKEMTKQATSLLLRSNAVYEDILDDVEVTLKVRGLSDSTENQSKTQEPACEICKTFHGAPFCIIDEINQAEKIWADRFKPKPSVVMPDIQWKEPRRESISDLSIGIETWRKPHKLPKMTESVEKSETPIKDEPWSFKIDANATPEEILTNYEIMCTRFGNSSGRRYVLASSLAADTIQTPPQSQVVEKFEDRDLERRREEFRKKEIECLPPEPPISNFLCPEYSEEVREKFEKVVDSSPICYSHDIVHKKRWKDILCKPRKLETSSKIRQEVEYIGEDDDRVNRRKVVVCRCAAMDCDCGGITGCSTKTAKKKCELLYEENNYLNTVRNRRDRRRLVKMNQRKSSMTLSGTSRRQMVGATRRHSSTFLHLAYEETLTLLNECLWNQFEPHSDSDGFEKYQRKIEALARLASPSSMIALRDWNAWYETYAQQVLDNKEEDIESIDSDIQSSISEISDHSRRSSDLDYKERKMPPSRIPYASETYKLLNNLFEKISLKLEKTIMKNCKKSQLFNYRPLVAYYFKKLSTMRGRDEFKKVLDDWNQNYLHLKNLIPFKMLKRSKIGRMNTLKRKCRKLCNRREFVGGTQIGKRYKYRKNLKKYTKEGDYIGFTPEKRKLLRTVESKRLRSYDLVRDVAGLEISKKSMHDDYRLLCNLFDETSSDQRMNLLSEDMKRRKDKQIMREYGEPGLPEPPECSLSCLLTSGISPSSFRKYPEKGSVKMKGSLNSSNPMYPSILSNSSQSKSSEDRSSIDQKAKVGSTKSGRKVSQNLLLGSQNNDPNSPDLQHTNETESMTSVMRNAAAKITPPGSLSLSSQRKNSNSPRTSKNTISDQLASLSQRISGKESSKTIVGSSKFTQDSTQEINEPSLRVSSLVRQSQESTMSKLISASGAVTRQNVPGSFRVEGSSKMIPRGSKMDQDSIITERELKNTGSLVTHMGSKRYQDNVFATTESNVFQDNFVAGYGSKMIRESLIVEAGSRMLPSTIQSTLKVADEEQKVRPVSRLGHESDFLSDMSITKLRAMKPADRLGPTKKRIFGVDIGQGIHYVQYLRDNAAGADEERKQEMLNMLTQPREKKKIAPGKPVTSKQTLNTESFVGSSRQERLDSEKTRNSESSRKLKMSNEFDNEDSLARLHRHPIKTLDQIYKEVHGINARNTPISLIENDYEHELMKKQQLKKHRIKP
ncbi:hypothetical protein GE061_019755 [Apolygus lucorum]|uniref:Uncharacterized protein n=1 Tax=Apolygus lucorum TaxID=248454 RepID=A0A8S9X996_APOLU|nr:hypothetical protein GE061_019755 [Apolygus lucorum]